MKNHHAVTRVSAAVVFKAPAFQQGFQDRSEGRPFSPPDIGGAYPGISNAHISYERGRQFAAICCDRRFSSERKMIAELKLASRARAIL